MKLILQEGVRSLLNESISAEAVTQYETYCDLLNEWNQVMNLTGITEPIEVAQKHYLDSLACLLSHKFNVGASVIDVGTGAGFPGLPLKIFRPDLKLTLLDSLNKRIKFLQAVGEATKVHSVNYIHGRAEEVAVNKFHREKYDIAVARAVSKMNVLTEYCLPFVKVGGYFIAMKGKDVAEELKEAEKALKVLGGKLENVFLYQIPGTDIEHGIVVIQKIAPTPKGYPRKAGTPEKKPL